MTRTVDRLRQRRQKPDEASRLQHEQQQRQPPSSVLGRWLGIPDTSRPHDCVFPRPRSDPPVP